MLETLTRALARKPRSNTALGLWIAGSMGAEPELEVTAKELRLPPALRPGSRFAIDQLEGDELSAKITGLLEGVGQHRAGGDVGGVLPDGLVELGDLAAGSLARLD